MSLSILQEREQEYRLKAQRDLLRDYSFPNMDQLKAKWKQQVGNAKIAWGKLTEDELLESEGHVERLAGLVQERYAISRIDAQRQVHAFLQKTYS